MNGIAFKTTGRYWRSACCGDNAKSTFAIRVSETKNRQQRKINRFQDLLDFKKALRDHTQSTRPVRYEGKDMIQTTTDE